MLPYSVHPGKHRKPKKREPTSNMDYEYPLALNHYHISMVQLEKIYL